MASNLETRKALCDGIAAKSPEARVAVFDAIAAARTVKTPAALPSLLDLITLALEYGVAPKST